MPCQAVLCQAKLCQTVLCHVEPCRAGPCCAEPCQAVPSSAVLSRAKQCHVEPCRAELCRAEPCQTVPTRSDPSRAKSCRAVLQARSRRPLPAAARARGRVGDEDHGGGPGLCPLQGYRAAGGARGGLRDLARAAEVRGELVTPAVRLLNPIPTSLHPYIPISRHPYIPISLHPYIPISLYLFLHLYPSPYLYPEAPGPSRSPGRCLPS